MYKDPRRQGGDKLFEIINSHELKEGDESVDTVEMFKDHALTDDATHFQPKHLNTSFSRNAPEESERRRLRREKRQQTVQDPPHMWKKDI